LNTIPPPSAFKATRKHHSEELAEDYTEIISDLIAIKGSARIGEIAKHLGVSHVTAIRTIQRLQDQGYVTTKPKSPIELTIKGKNLAKFSKYRHDLLIQLFLKLGIPQKIAEIDVEGAEHHISKKSLDYIEAFLKNNHT
jgi:DtxR family manganese transport transcriptional regulator